VAVGRDPRQLQADVLDETEPVRQFEIAEQPAIGLLRDDCRIGGRRWSFTARHTHSRDADAASQESREAVSGYRILSADQPDSARYLFDVSTCHQLLFMKQPLNVINTCKHRVNMSFFCTRSLI